MATAPKMLAKLLLLAVLLHATTASLGDMDVKYRNRLIKCIDLRLGVPPTALSLRLTCWDADADCRYQSMHATVLERRADASMHFEVETADEGRVLADGPVLQYYGKWPFERVLGIQEVASVAFSGANLWQHVVGMRRVRARCAASASRRLYLSNGLIACNAWFWSAVFHTRDVWWTEALDYHGASSVTSFTTFIAVTRVLELGGGGKLALALPFALGYGYHVWRCTAIAHGGGADVPQFDYGYNMQANLLLSAVHALVWIAWLCYPLVRETRPRAGWEKLTLFLMRIAMFLLLEVLDFPPIAGLLDAHALWHLATAFLVPIWYAFVVEDVNAQAEKWPRRLRPRKTAAAVKDA